MHHPRFVILWASKRLTFVANHRASLELRQPSLEATQLCAHDLTRNRVKGQETIAGARKSSQREDMKHGIRKEVNDPLLTIQQ